VAAGFAASDFWFLSPRLYLVHMRGANARSIADQRARDIQSWTVAALSRTPDFPSYASFIDGASSSPAQSPDILQKNLDQLALAWGAKEIA